MHFLLALVLFSVSAMADVVPGFEDAAVFKDVMAGKIKVQELAATDTKATFVIRAFFPKTSSDLYVDLVTNHKEYPAMFSEIKDAKTLSANAERTEWTYWMDILITHLIFSQHIYPEGKQVYQRAADAVSEGVLTHTLSNYGEDMKEMVQKTRLIPYQGGILVHDYIHYESKKSSSFSGTIQKKLKEQFVRFMTVYRRKLSGS